jgi:hypothetical protein
MPQCASVKNKKSEDQCVSQALLGHTVCGVHARAKAVVLWADVNRDKIKRFTKVQALYRGWRVRRVLVWAGPGVLQRSTCVNDDDLVTCETKDKQHPFEYFGLLEGGKIWWFDFATAWEWFTRTVSPLNPYTKVAIDHADLTRMRKIHLYRRRHQMPVPPPPRVLSDNILRRWTILSQIFRSFGFEDVHPQQFANLNHENIRVMFRFLMDDLTAMPKPNQRLLAICLRGSRGAQATSSGYVINSLNLLTIALTDSQSYDFVFLLLSALYRC